MVMKTKKESTEEALKDVRKTFENMKKKREWAQKEAEGILRQFGF